MVCPLPPSYSRCHQTREPSAGLNDGKSVQLPVAYGTLPRSQLQKDRHMATSLSTLGIIHTTLSLLPVISGACAFYRHGRIDPASAVGRWYQVGLLASVITAFGLSSTGGFTTGHALGLVALAALAVAHGSAHVRRLGAGREYLQVGAMTFSYLVLMIPGLNETLSRLPVANPIGNGPDSPEVKAALLVAFLVFLAGLSYQLLQLRRRHAHLPSVQAHA